MVNLVLRKWNTDMVCLRETKMKEVDHSCVKQVGGTRLSEWVELGAQGSSGGVLIFWDKKRWNCLDDHQGQHSIAVSLEDINTGQQFGFT